MSNRAEGCENLDTFFPEDLTDYWFHSHYFFPNSCHLCSPNKNNEFDKLIRCEKCNMISYCGELHKKQHETRHQDLCKVIQNLLESSGSTNLFGFLQELQSPNEILNRKYSLISVVEEKLERKLYNDEKQMFLYPRVCFTCLESNPTSLGNCKSCPQVSFCKEHEYDIDDHKESGICRKFNLCFHLDWRFMLDERHDIFLNTKNFPFLGLNPETFQPPNNMDAFLKYLGKKEETGLMKTLNETEWSHMCSHLYTNSLTLMHVIHEFGLQNKSSLVIHIVGIPNTRRKDFAIHEVLLHLIPKLKTLKIVAVGEELKQDDSEITRKIGICHKCVTVGKTFSTECYKKPYVSYVEEEFFTTPDFIITFNFGDESEVHMWAESLLEIMLNIEAPFVMTTNTKLGIETHYQEISKHFGYLNKLACHTTNEFPSSRPCRDALENEFKYDNKYIAFYYLCQMGTDEETDMESYDSQISTNSIENIEQSPESSPDKEEILKDIQEKDVLETLDSDSIVTEMSKLLLDDIVDPSSQNQERDKKKEDDLDNKEESGAKVSSSDKGTEEMSEKLGTEEQRSNLENEQKESKPNSESYPEGNKSETKTSFDSSTQSKASEGKEKPKDESKDATKSETAMAVADRSNKSRKSKTDKSSEHSVKKDELDARLKETKRRILKVKEENAELFVKIEEAEDEILKLKRMESLRVYDLLKESVALKVYLDDCKEKLSEALHANAE